MTWEVAVPGVELHAPPPPSLGRKSWVEVGTTLRGRLYRHPVLAVGNLWHPTLRVVEVNLRLMHLLAATYEASGPLPLQLPAERSSQPGPAVGLVVAMAVRGAQLVADFDIQAGCRPAPYRPAVTLFFDDIGSPSRRGPAITTVHLRKKSA